MEAPFDTNTWEGISGAYYTGYGSAEVLWVIVCLALVVLAVNRGWAHERHAYRAVTKKD